MKYELSTDYEAMFDSAIYGLRTYVEENKLETVVIGLSGGIDSAITAALAKIALEGLPVEIIGAVLPIISNKPEETKRGDAIGQAFTSAYMMPDLDLGFLNLLNAVDSDLYHKHQSNSMTMDEKIRAGNIKARIRMIYLYDAARDYNGIVLSTDNLTEYLLGFWSLHGDCGDYGMIQNLWKTEVYGLAKWIVDNKCNEQQAKALRACIDATPTDGLGITDSDLDQLGATDYDEVDNILIEYLSGEKKASELVAEDLHPVIKRYEATHYKRVGTVNISRGNILSGGWW